MYFATRSPRAGAPLFICPAFTATARSEIVVSSVSPLRWLTIVVYPALCASSIVSKVSVSVPIWLTFTSIELPTPSSMPRVSILGFVTNRSSPTSCSLLPSFSVSVAQPSQSPSSRPSSMRKDRVLVREVCVVVDHLLAGESLAFAGEFVGAVVVELGGSRVEGEADLVSKRVAAPLDGLGDKTERRAVALEVRGETTLIPDAAGEAFLAEQLLEYLVDLRDGAKRLGVGVEPEGHDHELLKVHVVRGVLSTVHNIAARNRQSMGPRASQITIKRERRRLRRGFRGRQGYTQQGVRAEATFIVRAVSLDHGEV